MCNGHKMIYFKILLVLQLNIILYYCVKFCFVLFFLIQASLAVNPFNDFYSVLCLEARSFLIVGCFGEGLWLYIAVCR